MSKHPTDSQHKEVTTGGEPHCPICLEQMKTGLAENMRHFSPANNDARGFSDGELTFTVLRTDEVQRRLLERKTDDEKE